MVYDTCVQVIHVVTPLPVPLSSGRMMIVLGVALVAVTAVFFRRRFAVTS